MKQIKGLLGVIILSVLMVIPAWADAGKVRLTLPVRAWEEKQPCTELQKENFKLIVDDQPAEILEVVKQVASMEQRSEFLGRNFILSFQVVGYGVPLKEAVSYFITEILDSTDSLILFTPLSIYKYNVSANKEKIIRDVEKLVKKDCDVSRKTFEAVERNLEIQINQLQQQLSMEIDTDPGLVATFKAIGTFLSSFPKEFLNFRNQYLFPNPDKYRQVIACLGNREGQRWWIHFQQGDIYRVISKAHLAAKKIDNVCNLYEHVRFAFQTQLNLLEKHFQLAESFPAQQFLNTFTNSNIRYNALLWEQYKRGELPPEADAIAQLEAILNQVSLDTGGKLIHTTSLEQGMKNLHVHQDHYYELTYDFDGSAGEKKIQLTAAADNKKNIRLYYQGHYTEEEIRSLVQSASQEHVQIAGFALDKNRTKFSIQSIALDDKKTFGLVKVRIELYGQESECVYRTENTLRSSRPDINISIAIPSQHRGAFKLVITVSDIIANRLATLEKEIILK